MGEWETLGAGSWKALHHLTAICSASSSIGRLLMIMGDSCKVMEELPFRWNCSRESGQDLDDSDVVVHLIDYSDLLHCLSALPSVSGGDAFPGRGNSRISLSSL